MKKLHSLFRRPEFSIFLFFASFLFFSWPLLVFNPKPKPVFFFLFICWAIVIVALFFISKNYQPPDSDQNKRKGGGNNV